jgi:small-conductance mechanosensitive channel
MIPQGIPNSTAVINTLTDETNLIGTASTREIVLLFVLVIVAYLVGLIIAHYLKLKLSHRLKTDQLTRLTRVVRLILILFVVSISIPGLLDLSITIFVLIVVALFAIIGLSSQKVISNMVGGFAMLYESPFGAGDFINTGTVSGTVISTRLFSVLVRTTSGVHVQIPNDQIYSSDVSNYFAHVARRYEYVVGIRYQDDVKKATGIIAGILKDYTFVLANPAPEVFVSDIDADSVRVMFRVWFPSVWAKTKDDVSLQTAILPRVKAALEAGGIEMPYAHREILINNPCVTQSGTGTAQHPDNFPGKKE